MYDWLTAHKIPLGAWLNNLVDLLNDHAQGVFDFISLVLGAMIDGLTDGLLFIPPLILVALIGVGMLAVATFWAVRRWVIRPLDRLGSEADVVEAGDLTHRVEVADDAPREILVLAGQVDRMRARVVANASLAERARTEATEARALVEAQAEDLRRSNTELEQFAYVASHDLQEPLRKVASFCQLIERRYTGQLDERGEQYIEFAVDGAKRMQQLIQDLLMFSRVGRQSTGFQETDLEQVLAQALRQLDSAVEESDAVVTHDPLPTVDGDPSLLVQLFQNLVGNGLKFHGDERPRVHLSASPSATRGLWEFACTDNGIGIEPQYADKIFVIFQRLHGRDTYTGTGIGLAMCKKIVEHHGGRLWLDTASRDTPGTVFRWTLPERQADPEPAYDASVLHADETERTSHDATVRG
jgi:signal transduction histidine kinase